MFRYYTNISCIKTNNMDKALFLTLFFFQAREFCTMLRNFKIKYIPFKNDMKRWKLDSYLTVYEYRMRC